MEEQLNPLVITHLLQHTLRSLCIHENSQWVYAVFWRILPRNYPPPKWDLQGGAFDRSRGNRRNWILVWEDGFCNFAAATSGEQVTGNCATSSAYADCETQHIKGLQPELFFKMSHEIYNYGEGLIGKVAADHSHKWVFKEPQEQEVNFLSSWHNPVDSHPRTWEAQFQSGIKTIALIAVKEGVVQLGATNKVMEDLSYVVLLRKKFNYLENIPGVLLPHPSSSSMFPIKVDGCTSPENWAFHAAIAPPAMDLYNQFSPQMRITPSMSSLEALLSKLPSVGPPPSASSSGYLGGSTPLYFSPERQVEMMGMEKIMAKEEEEVDDGDDQINVEYGHGGRGIMDMAAAGVSSSSSMSSYYVNLTKSHEGF